MSSTTGQEPTEANKAAEDQNTKAQEEARKKIEEEQNRLKEARVKAASGEVEEVDYTFQAAAKALEEVEQPPNMGSAHEDKERAQAGAKAEKPVPPVSPPSAPTVAPAPRRRSTDGE